MRAKAVGPIVAAMWAVAAIPKAVAVLNIMSGLTTPIAHLAVVFAPGMNGMITNGDLSPSSLFALKVGGLVHIAIDVATDAGNGISSGKVFWTPVYGQSFSLKGFFEDSDMIGDLCGFGVVGAEVLDFTLESGVAFIH